MIPMRQSFDKVTFLTGSAQLLEELPQVKTLPVFSDDSVGFLSALSAELLKDAETKRYPDLTAYAFWIRKASLETQRRRYQNAFRVGRGLSFHIAPSNVPVAFALSFTAGLLAGNVCVVRVSNKEFQQVEIIVRAIKKLLNGAFTHFAPYLYLVRYEHDAQITQEFSALCDVRVIWGGNQTIGTIRSAKLPPRAVELTFADRHSLAVIDADRYLELDAQKVAENFYTDTYYSDQNACSSPRLVFWLGKSIAQARERFWNTLENYIRSRYEIQPIQSVDKLDALCRLAAEHPDVRKVGNANQLIRVLLPKLYPEVMDYKEGGGYFFEYEAKTLMELMPALGKPCQTVAYLGIDPEEIMEFAVQSGVRGVDRVVPLGATMALSLIWDGFDLVESMSRLIYLER